MNAILHVFEENFAREKCFEKSTSILCPVMNGCICSIISLNHEGIFQTKSLDDTPLWLPPVPLFCVCLEGFKQQYTSFMEVGTGGNLGLSREYHKKLFGPILTTSITMPNLKQTPKWVSEATNIVFGEIR